VRARRWLAATLAAFSAVCVAEPPNAVLLVAKPGLVDPNFNGTVVLVTQAEDASTVGVILNSRTSARHESTGEPIYRGGPVMPRTIVALFRSENVPPVPSFQVLQGIYLSMHPGIVERLKPPFRLYAGFAGWMPGQLESEIARRLVFAAGERGDRVPARHRGHVGGARRPGERAPHARGRNPVPGVFSLARYN